MLKYNLNFRNGNARARIWIAGQVTALTLSLGFTSQAAVGQESDEMAMAVSCAKTVLTDSTSLSVCKKMAGSAGVKLVSGMEESFNRIEEELEAQQETVNQRCSEENTLQRTVRTVSAENESEKELLASIIFCEAGNQSFTGQVAVGAVVMNRIASGSFPNTMEEVIYQPGQFGPAGTGWLDQVRSVGGYTESAMQAAEAALAGENPIGGCLYFDQGGYGMQIGAHYFH